MNTGYVKASFLSIEDVEGISIIHYYLDDSYQWAVNSSSPALFYRLPPGAIIELKLTEGFINGTEVNLAELHMDEDSMLPADLLSFLRTSPPSCRIPGAFLATEKDNKGSYYSLKKTDSSKMELCLGEYEIRNESGICQSPTESWLINPGLLENYFFNRTWPSHQIKTWKYTDFAPDDSYDYLTEENLSIAHRDNLADNPALTYYRSSDWSPAFYRKQAELGFIAVSGKRINQTELLPELQSAYALLDWRNLHIDRKTAKILSGSRMKTENIRLRIDPDPGLVMENLERMWKGSTWLSPPYKELIRNLASEEEKVKNPGFRIWGVSLHEGPHNQAIAGELGYTIGRTYTSLSGFFHRGEKQYDNFGKLQMVLLARKLESAGIFFWNLGHPHMPYKTALGAKILKRKEFLQRWDRAVQGKSPDLTEL
ncbi:hypothetical protein [Spirochaeta isovalerica]|uniref:Uncharacterized protein n=1 Tax=Spirochaeta isovalerica TaxID=150 RepID=A0A841RDN1_9SPIO|nr:hypothetical protein [Spirochaeta isovalerica]MBB6481491.1 hypothetical protein [Spirochaeta isovalerica]